MKARVKTMKSINVKEPQMSSIPVLNQNERSYENQNNSVFTVKSILLTDRTGLKSAPLYGIDDA